MDDREKAKSEFKHVEPIDSNEEDVEILQFFIDIYSEEMAFSDKIAYIDRVIEKSVEIGDIIQYRTLRAVE